MVFGAVFLVQLLPEGNVFRCGFEDGGEAGFDAAIARSAGRKRLERSLIEAEEDLDLDQTSEAEPIANS